MAQYGPIAYMYQADFHCTSCHDSIVSAIQRDAPDKVPADLYDEYTFDSDDYPKAVLGTLEGSRLEHCGTCGAALDTYIYHDAGDDDCECDDCR